MNVPAEHVMLPTLKPACQIKLKPPACLSVLSVCYGVLVAAEKSDHNMPREKSVSSPFAIWRVGSMAHSNPFSAAQVLYFQSTATHNKRCKRNLLPQSRQLLSMRNYQFIKNIYKDGTREGEGFAPLFLTVAPPAFGVLKHKTIRGVPASSRVMKSATGHAYLIWRQGTHWSRFDRRKLFGLCFFFKLLASIPSYLQFSHGCRETQFKWMSLILGSKFLSLSFPSNHILREPHMAKAYLEKPWKVV